MKIKDQILPGTLAFPTKHANVGGHEQDGMHHIKELSSFDWVDKIDEDVA